LIKGFLFAFHCLRLKNRSG